MKNFYKIYLATTKEVQDLDNSFVGIAHSDPQDIIEPIEYIHKDTFIEKACKWIKENITNNPNANSVLVRNGCVTLGMLIEDFKNYMKEEKIG